MGDKKQPIAPDARRIADDLESEYLAVANGVKKPAKLAMEPMVRAVEALRALGDNEMTLGVGDGGGNLFVHGSYDAIKRAQAIVLEYERLQAARSADATRIAQSEYKRLRVSLASVILSSLMADDDDQVVRMAQRLVEWLSPSSAHIESTPPVPLGGVQIRHMVDRFLGWHLPDTFSPDAGISFKPTFNEHLPNGPMRHEPTGTNLFDAQQPEAMVRYMVEGLPAPSPMNGADERAAKFSKGQTVFCRAVGKGLTPLTVTRIDEFPDTFVYRVSGADGWYSFKEHNLGAGIPVDVAPTHTGQQALTYEQINEVWKRANGTYLDRNEFGAMVVDFAHAILATAAPAALSDEQVGDYAEQNMLTFEEAEAELESAIQRAEGRPRECSGDPTSCPDNEGCGCWCSDQVAAPATADARDAWQPMETAPQTGRTLLLGYHNVCGKWRTVRGQWMSQEYIDEYWEEPENGEPGWFETSVEADYPPNCWAINPTHWMPLPAAPAMQRSGQ